MLVYTGCESKQVVGRYTNAMRAIALARLIKITTDEVTPDLALIYAYNTSPELYDYLLSCARACGKPDDSGNYDILDLTKFILPKSIKKMTKEYFIRCFWRQVRFALGCQYSMNFTERKMCPSSPPAEIVFPQSVRNAMSCMFIPDRGDITDLDRPLASLRDAVLNTKIVRDTFRPSNANWGSLSNVDMRKIFMIRNIVGNYCSEMEIKASFPDKTGLRIISDWIEIFTIMFGFYTFTEGLSARNALDEDYNCITGTTTVDNGRKLPWYKSRDRHEYEYHAAINTAMKIAQHLSPQAALVTEMTKVIEYESSYWANRGTIAAVSRNLNKKFIPEVKMFMKHELNAQAIKDRYIKDLIAKEKCRTEGDSCDDKCDAEEC